MRVNRAKLRELAVITLEREHEDMDYKSHFDDSSAVDWIREQLQMGNRWAWCCAHVSATYGDIQTDTYLGACSYESEQDFKNGGYYEDMVDEVIEELADRIETMVNGFVETHDLWEHDVPWCLWCAAS